MLAFRATVAVGNSYQAGVLGSGLAKEDVERTKWEILGFLNPLIPYLGWIWTYVSGLILMYIFVSVFLACVYRITRTYLDHGCGLWCVGAVFNTVFTMARTGPALAKATARITTRGMRDEFPMPTLRRDSRSLGSRGGRSEDVEAGAAGGREPAPAYDQVRFEIEDEGREKTPLERAHLRMEAASEPLLRSSARYASPTAAPRLPRDSSLPNEVTPGEAAAILVDPEVNRAGSPHQSGLPTAVASTQVRFGRPKL